MSELAEIIFCKPVHHYDSYTDFWRLVELSNFPVIRVDEIDITQPGIYVTAPMNGDFEQHMVGDFERWRITGEITGGQIQKQKQSGLPRLAHLILWNLERPSGSKTIDQYNNDNRKLFYGRLVDEIWVSDSVLADETMFRYVILGSDYGLGEISDDKKYDFTHQSVVISRRVSVYKHFGAGQIGENCWPPERDNILKQSKFALNVHQDNHPFCEPLRIALFAAYGLPVVSEMLTTPNPYSDIRMHSYAGLVSGLKQALNDDYEPWKQRGLKLRDKLCDELQFGKMVRKAVYETAGGEWR